jgi:hypothetical protein
MCVQLYLLDDVTNLFNSIIIECDPLKECDRFHICFEAGQEMTW